MKQFLVLIATLALTVGSSRLVVADMVDIDNKKLQELIEQGVPVIDVRRVDEWKQTGVIDGSHLLTFFDKAGRYDAEKWKSTLSGKIDTSEPVILICHSGVRTSIIAKWLGEQMETVYNVDEGIAQWIRAGNATVPATL